MIFDFFLNKNKIVIIIKRYFIFKKMSSLSNSNDYFLLGSILASFLVPLLCWIIGRFSVLGLIIGLIISMIVQCLLIWKWTRVIKEDKDIFHVIISASSASLWVMLISFLLNMLIGTLIYYNSDINNETKHGILFTIGLMLLVSGISYATWFASMKIVIKINE